MALVKHYLFPERYASEFRAAESAAGRRIALEDFAIGVETEELGSFPDYETFNAAWEGAWQAFFEERKG